MNELSQTIIAAATERHRQLGAGLLEGAEKICLAHELNLQGIQAVRQKQQPNHYQGLKPDEAYRIDTRVEDQIISGFQALDAPNSIHLAQLLTDLQLSACTLDCRRNFNVELLKNTRFESFKITQLLNSISHSAPSANAAVQPTQPKS